MMALINEAIEQYFLFIISKYLNSKLLIGYIICKYVDIMWNICLQISSVLKPVVTSVDVSVIIVNIQATDNRLSYFSN